MTNHSDSAETRINVLLAKQWRVYQELLRDLKKTNKVEHDGRVIKGDLWIISNEGDDKCYRIVSADKSDTMGDRSFDMLDLKSFRLNNHATWGLLSSKGILVQRGSGEVLFDGGLSGD